MLLAPVVRRLALLHGSQLHRTPQLVTCNSCDLCRCHWGLICSAPGLSSMRQLYTSCLVSGWVVGSQCMWVMWQLAGHCCVSRDVLCAEGSTCGCDARLQLALADMTVLYRVLHQQQARAAIKVLGN